MDPATEKKVIAAVTAGLATTAHLLGHDNLSQSFVVLGSALVVALGVNAAGGQLGRGIMQALVQLAGDADASPSAPATPAVPPPPPTPKV